MKRAPLKLPFEYRDTPDLRVLDLTPDGIRCIPVLGRTHLRSFGPATTSEEHEHEECIEISFCQRGELVFDSMGKEYPFHPGMVFVSRPNERHHLRVFPKGLLMYWLFFRIPKRNGPLLSLPPKEARWLTDSLLSMPHRLFQGGDRIRLAFQRVFNVYDSEPAGTPQRTFRLRVAVQDLLLALVDASNASPTGTAGSRLEQAVAEIRADPVKPISLDALVARFAISPSSLIQQFKQLTGLPPVAFRNACRIDLAKRELENGVRSIAGLAAMLGYSSAQNFATQFRLATGKTPREWRHRALGISPKYNFGE